MKKITKTMLIGWISLVFAVGFTGCTILNFDKSCEHTYDNACDITCNECGEKRTVTHNWENADCTTPKTCKVCGMTSGHALDHKAKADDGDCTTSITCAECTYVFTEAKSHDFTGEWQKNETEHWHVCQNEGCNVTDEKIDHNPNQDNATITAPKKCVDCDYIIEPQIEHKHSYTIEEYNETHHYTRCDCGEIDDSTKVAHSANSDNDCTTDDICACGYIVEVAKNHEVAVDDNDCSTALTCVNCDYIFVEAKQHNFEEELGSLPTYHAYFCLNDGCVGYINREEHHGEDDGDCTTRILCECGWLIEDANESHTPGVDDGDCTTPVYCANCDQIAIPAKETHVVTKNPATCITMGPCDECGTAFQEYDANNHESEEFVYENNGNGTHKKTYKCCGATVEESESHTLGTDNTCVCGAKVLATITDGNTTIYAYDKDSLNQAVTIFLVSGRRTFTVDLPADASAEILIAIRRALIDTEEVDNGSVNLTLTGVKAIPDYSGEAGSGIFGAWYASDSPEEVNALGSITLTDATYIGKNTFYFALPLSSVSAPLVTEIGNSAFEDTQLSEVYLPRVEKVGANAFLSCLLTEISFPLAKTIGAYAFSGCDNLTKVSLPSATVIGSYAFQSSKKITELVLGELESVDHAHFGIFYGGADTSNISLTLPCTQKALVFGEDDYWTATDTPYTETEDYANNVFMGYTFKSVAISHDYKYTDNGDGTHTVTCVCGAKATASVTDGSTILYADINTLNAAVSQLLAQGKTNITVDLPADAPAEMITAIRRAICDTEGVADGSINLTLKGVTAIPAHSTEAKSGYAMFGQIEYDKNGNWLDERVLELNSISLPDVVTIGSKAFLYCQKMTSINAPKVQTIGERAFVYTGLVSVELPEATTLENLVFYNCSALTEIKLPKVTKLGNQSLDTGSVDSTLTIYLTTDSEIVVHKDLFYWLKHYDHLSTKVNLVLNSNKQSKVSGNTWVAKDANGSEVSLTFKSITFAGGATE